MITEAEFTAIALPIALTGMMGYMVFIIYKLGKDSNAGKFGMFILFITLAVGMFGFVLKFIIKLMITANLE